MSIAVSDLGFCLFYFGPEDLAQVRLDWGFVTAQVEESPSPTAKLVRACVRVLDGVVENLRTIVRTWRFVRCAGAERETERGEKPQRNSQTNGHTENPLLWCCE